MLFIRGFDDNLRYSTQIYNAQVSIKIFVSYKSYYVKKIKFVFSLFYIVLFVSWKSKDHFYFKIVWKIFSLL